MLFDVAHKKKKKQVDAIGLGCAAVSGLLKKTKLNPEYIDEIIWGNVVLNTRYDHVTRFIF